MSGSPRTPGSSVCHVGPAVPSVELALFGSSLIELGHLRVAQAGSQLGGWLSGSTPDPLGAGGTAAALEAMEAMERRQSPQGGTNGQQP